MEQEDVLSLLL